jgi:putative addiction module CopG family antidote
MTVTLKPDLERFVAEQVSAGRYASPAEVLEAAVARLMLDPPGDELEEQDRRDIERGLNQMRSGQVVDWKSHSAPLRRHYLGR